MSDFVFFLAIPVSNFNAAVNNSLDNAENGRAYDTDSLPSYTLVSGLPSYDDALEFYRSTQLAAPTISRPSLMKLFSFESHQIKEIGANDLAGEGLFYENGASGNAAKKEQLQVVQLPTYEETVDEKKASSKKINRQILHFDFKLKPSNFANVNPVPNSSAMDMESISTILGQASTRKFQDLPKLHKSPSLVVIYDNDFWRNLQHPNVSDLSPTEDQPLSGSSSRPNYTSNSLPRNISRQLLASGGESS